MTWSVLQSAKTAASGTANTQTATFTTANASSGSKLIAAVGWSNIGTTSIASVQDAALNSMTQVGFISDTANTTGAALYAMDTPAGDVGIKPAIKVTFTAGQTPGCSLVILEVSGIAAGNTLAAMIDGGALAASNSGAAATTFNSGAYSSTASGEFLIGVFGDDGGPELIAKPGAWSTLDGNSVNNNSIADCCVAYTNSSNAAEGGASAQWSKTSGTGTGWANLLTAFKIAAGGAAAPSGVSPAQPGRTWLRRFHHRQQPQSFPAAVTAAQAGPPVKPAGSPVRAPVPALRRGGTVISRGGTYSQAGPPVRPLRGPVAARVRVLPLRGRVSSRAGAYAGSGPPVPAPHGPVQPRRLPQRGGSAAWRAGTWTFIATGSGPPVYPLHGPVQARRLPQRGGSTSRRAGIYAQPGAPVRPLPGPVEARQPLPPRGRTASRAGIFTLVVTGSGPPVYPLGHPVQARRQPALGGRVIRRAGSYAGSGPPVKPLQQPIGIYRRQPPPPARGRTASQRGPYAQAGPPVIRLRRPVRGQPSVPLLTGRADWRAGIAVFVPPPPFTIGALTAADTRQASLTAAGASSALTAGTAPAGGTLTAADQRTGGPG